MATPFSVIGSFNIPGDNGLPPDAIPITFNSNYDSEASVVLNLSGSGTKSISLGSIGSPGLKGLYIKVDSNPTSTPILIQVNQATTGRIEIAPGGFLVYGNPVPSAGIINLDIVFTTACVVRIWAVG